MKTLPTARPEGIARNVAPSVSRTIIPLSYNPSDPLGEVKWRQHILFENYSHLGNRMVKKALKILQSA